MSYQLRDSALPSPGVSDISEITEDTTENGTSETPVETSENFVNTSGSFAQDSSDNQLLDRVASRNFTQDFSNILIMMAGRSSTSTPNTDSQSDSTAANRLKR